MYNIECYYKHRCSSYPYRCNTCRHNRNKKKDFFEPDDDWHSWPWWYRGERYPYKIWCEFGKDDGEPKKTIMYESKYKKKDYYKE